MIIDELTLLTNIDQKLGQIVHRLSGKDESEVDIETEESAKDNDAKLLLEEQI
jgi:hypothetical protein